MMLSIMSLVLAIAPMCSVAPRFAVFRPATLAANGGVTLGTHGRGCMEETEADISTGAQRMQHLSSRSCHGARPESGRVPRLINVLNLSMSHGKWHRVAAKVWNGVGLFSWW